MYKGGMHLFILAGLLSRLSVLLIHSVFSLQRLAQSCWRIASRSSQSALGLLQAAARRGRWSSPHLGRPLRPRKLPPLVTVRRNILPNRVWGHKVQQIKACMGNQRKLLEIAFVE